MERIRIFPAVKSEYERIWGGSQEANTVTSYSLSPRYRPRGESGLQREMRLYGYDWSGRVLELGCGLRPIVTVGLAPGDQTPSRRVGADLSFQAMRVSRLVWPAIQWINAAGEALPFKSNTFDFVTEGSALEYAEDPNLFVAEMIRVARPGGRLALAIGTPEHAKSWNFAQWVIERADMTRWYAGLEDAEIVQVSDQYIRFSGRKPAINPT